MTLAFGYVCASTQDEVRQGSNERQKAEILRMRAKESLNEYGKESLGLLSALLVRDYRRDARIGIEALEILGRSDKWDEDSIKTALK
jgi:hypothetical protein